MVPKFNVGDRVHHIGRRENGTVTGTGDRIVVEFDNPTPRGNKSIGVFDDLWFRSHDGWLQPVAALGQD